jgi:hypothetical protein
MDPLMSLWVFCIGIILGIIGGVVLSYKTAVTPLKQRTETLTIQQQRSSETMKYYPYDPDNFRFIGSPVDGIQFEEDRILFVRFSKGTTPRTKEQDHIKTLLENGKVSWFEFMTRELS